MNNFAKTLTLGFALLAAFPSFSTAASAADEATRALKAYWVVLDNINYDEHQLDMQLDQQHAKITNRFSLVTTPKLAARLQFKPHTLQAYSRDITNTKVESESQVSIEVVIKNVTPIPAEGVLEGYTAKFRKEGKLYQYIVVRVGNKWRVAEIWEWHDYEEAWQKRKPDEATPFIHTDTLFGH